MRRQGASAYEASRDSWPGVEGEREPEACRPVS